MINEHDAARVFDNVLLAAKTEIHPDDLRYCHHASGRYSERYHFIYILTIENLVSNPYMGAYSAFFQLPIRNSMNGIHNPADNALATTKKMNFARYLTLSLKAHSITKRNNSAIPLVE